MPNNKRFWSPLRKWYKIHTELGIDKIVWFKIGLSASKIICVICLIEIPFKIMKNALYFILKALLVLKIFKFLSRRFGHVGKMAWLER